MKQPQVTQVISWEMSTILQIGLTAYITSSTQRNQQISCPRDYNSCYSPQFGSAENWNFVFVVQVTVASPLSLYPSLQLRDRTVPVETGNFLSAFMLVQVVFRPVQSEILTSNREAL